MKFQDVMTYIDIDVRNPADLDQLSKETGYSVEEIERYLWNASFANMTKMKLPIRNMKV